MSITSSVIVEDSAQADLRRQIIEHHIDHLSVIHVVSYLAESGADVTAAMNGRVSSVEAGLANSERETNLGLILEGTSPPPLQHGTSADMQATARELFF